MKEGAGPTEEARTREAEPTQDGARTEALVIHQAAVAYERTPVLEGIDGVVHAGESVALIGPNGAGKSTLLKAVLGLVPVVGGSITVLGRSPSAARRQVAYVPQADTLDTEFPVTAGQVVLMGRYPRVGWVRCGACAPTAPPWSSPPTTTRWRTCSATRSACSTGTSSGSARSPPRSPRTCCAPPTAAMPCSCAATT